MNYSKVVQHRGKVVLSSLQSSDTKGRMTNDLDSGSTHMQTQQELCVFACIASVENRTYIANRE